MKDDKNLPGRDALVGAMAEELEKTFSITDQPEKDDWWKWLLVNVLYAKNMFFCFHFPERIGGCAIFVLEKAEKAGTWKVIETAFVHDPKYSDAVLEQIKKRYGV